MHTHAFAVAIIVSLAAASLPERAQACSCLPAPINYAQPKDGAAGVPRDIAPVLEGPFEQTKITFEDEHGGQP